MTIETASMRPGLKAREGAIQFDHPRTVNGQLQ